MNFFFAFAKIKPTSIFNLKNCSASVSYVPCSASNMPNVFALPNNVDKYEVCYQIS